MAAAIAICVTVHSTPHRQLFLFILFKFHLFLFLLLEFFGWTILYCGAPNEVVFLILFQYTTGRLPTRDIWRGTRPKSFLNRRKVSGGEKTLAALFDRQFFRTAKHFCLNSNISYFYDFNQCEEKIRLVAGFFSLCLKNLLNSCPVQTP